MSTLSEARTAVAEAVSAVDGYNVRPRPFRNMPRAGDGWVVVSRLAPSDFTRSAATLTAVIVFGFDEVAAEQRLEDDGAALIDAVTSMDLPTADVALEPGTFLVGTNSTPVFGAELTLTTEVD